jgi:hypothetical protein
MLESVQLILSGLWSCLPQIFPDMFDDYSNLRPLKGAAEILAKDAAWGQLYDVDQLARNNVKVTTAT